MQVSQTMLATVIVGCISKLSPADITGFTDFEEWENAVGDYKTIDFTEYRQGTIITDQYADLGVFFTDGNDWIWHSSSFLNDGAGLRGGYDLQITTEYESPQLWFGIWHPGVAIIDIYSGDQLLGSFQQFGPPDFRFSGIVSEIAFDKVVIHRGGENVEPFIDDMHWGVPAPGALAVLGFAVLLGGSRRRRK